MPHASERGLPSPGSRVQINDCKATVKYVGEVKHQTGEWIGLEWDDAARGKNDGSTGGCRYFSCRRDAAGSFMRSEKFLGQAAQGQDILSSLQERYGDQPNDKLQGQETQQPSKRSGQKKGVEWQLVGADKVQAKLSELDTLQKASLISSQVATVVGTCLAQTLHACLSLYCADRIMCCYGAGLKL